MGTAPQAIVRCGYRCRAVPDPRGYCHILANHGIVADTASSPLKYFAAYSSGIMQPGGRKIYRVPEDEMIQVNLVILHVLRKHLPKDVLLAILEETREKDATHKYLEGRYVPYDYLSALEKDPNSVAWRPNDECLT